MRRAAGPLDPSSPTQSIAYPLQPSNRTLPLSLLPPSHDGRYLIITVSDGCLPVNKLWAVDLEGIPRTAADALDFSSYDFRMGSTPLPVIRLVDNFEAQWEYLGSRNTSEWTLMTNSEAPRYRVVRADISGGSLGGLHDMIPQHDKDLLQWAAEMKGGEGGVLAVCYLHDVASELQLRSYADGSLLRELALPGIGSVTGFSGSWKRSEGFFSFAGFTEPGATYRFDAAEPQAPPTLFRRTKLKLEIDPEDFETKQVFVTSKVGGLACGNCMACCSLQGRSG